VAVLYILINVAILYVLPVASIAGSPLAASQASAIAFGKNGTIFMTLISIFSLLSILNAYIMIPPRILYGLSRDGYFMKQGTILNTGGTPVYSALFCYFLALVLIVFSSFDLLFSLGAFMMTVVTGFAFASLIKLRMAEPELPRPYKAWGYPYTTVIAITVSIALFIGFSISDQKSLLIMLGVVLVSLPCYKYLVKKKMRMKTEKVA
jgi:basic amino acid/polyamine antiporter, APA family